MTKKYKDMDLEELQLEKLRLLYYIKNSKGNFIGVKQANASLRKIETLIAEKVIKHG